MKKLLIILCLSLQTMVILPALPTTIKKTVHRNDANHTNEAGGGASASVEDAVTNDQNFVYIIGGEITSTHVTIGIFKVENNHPFLAIEYHDKNQNIADIYQHFQHVLDDLKHNHGITIKNACFAIPGIAKGDLFLHPHLSWNTSDDESRHSDKSQKGISKQKILDINGLQHVYFINDFQAIAIGTQNTDEDSFICLHEGKKHPRKTKLIIGAGNGLGSALLLWNDELNGYIPSQLNYSFTEFGAQSELELAFFNFMKEETGNIAWGKVLGAGFGVKLMYRFFNVYDKQKEFEKRRYKHDKFVEYENYLDLFKNRDKSARCRDAVNLFVELYARLIRNATFAQSVGTVYITNTVVQELPELFATDAFMEKIIDLKNIVPDEGSKNYLENYLKDISFFLVRNPKVQLYGAAALCIEPNLIRN